MWQDVVGTEAHAAGVGALCLVEGLSVQQALAVYLEARSLWLRDDFSSSLESLDGDVRASRPTPTPLDHGAANPNIYLLFSVCVHAYMWLADGARHRWRRCS